MLTAIGTRTSPIGLCLHGQSVEVVQLTGTSQQLQLRSAVQLKFPVTTIDWNSESHQAAISSLRKAVQAQRLRGSRVVGALLTEELFIESIRLPLLPVHEIEAAVESEARTRLPFPVEEAELRHIVTGEVRGEQSALQEVMLLACRKSVIQERLRLLEELGLSPVGLDCEPLVWLRCLHHATEATETSPSIYLVCNEVSATILIAQGRKPLLIRTIPVGGQVFDKTISANLSLDETTSHSLRQETLEVAALEDDSEIHRSVAASLRNPLEEIAMELDRCLRHFAVTYRGRRLDRLVIAGTATAPWMADMFSNRLGLPCLQANPLNRIAIGAGGTGSQHRPNRWLTSLGLAMKRLP